MEAAALESMEAALPVMSQLPQLTVAVLLALTEQQQAEQVRVFVFSNPAVARQWLSQRASLQPLLCMCMAAMLLCQDFCGVLVSQCLRKPCCVSKQQVCADMRIVLVCCLSMLPGLHAGRAA